MKTVDLTDTEREMIHGWFLAADCESKAYLRNEEGAARALLKKLGLPTTDCYGAELSTDKDNGDA